LRIVYFGTPSDAVPALRALVGSGNDVALVVTQPDRRRGRGTDLTPSPVKQAAEELGLTVATPERPDEIIDDLRAIGAEVGVVVAYGEILSDAVLASAQSGFINVHFSLLPRWRGAAPVERAMLAGDVETGVQVMEVVSALDAGGIYASERTPIGDTETAGDLRERLVALGAELVVKTLPGVPTTTPSPQIGESTYAAKLKVEEFEIDLSRPAQEIDLLVRVGNPRPGAWLMHEGARLKVWSGALVSDSDISGLDVENETKDSLRFVPVEVQPEGRARMSYAAWCAGYKGTPPW
jgi:methionyl-tRNA formyltransferase